MLTGILSAFSGRMAGRGMTWCLAASGVLLALAAVLLLFQPAWMITRIEPGHTYGRHGWLVPVILFFERIGPQLTALIVGAIAFYILRGARDVRDLTQRGYYDKK